ncbi:MAG: bifunctional oligoribonuclease/PAP phosphatase NrnA [Patescibacteria group bacterium]|jgi:phosphoesterase RecJ-like protein
MIRPEVWRQAHQQLQAAKSILILNPKDPDGDSLGASLALRHHLLTLGKNVIVYAGKKTTRFDFLIGHDAIVTDWNDININQVELSVTVDFADPKQLGVSPQVWKMLSSKPLINIDHHGTNANFGSLNLVDAEAAATTELVYTYFETNSIVYDKEIATCLMAGIVYDTGNFVHINTTERVVKIASQLLLQGARLRAIVGRHRGKSMTQLKLLGLALSRLQNHPRYGVSITVITQNDLQGLEVTDEATDGIANFLNALDQTKAVIVLKEGTDGEVKGSIRSTAPGIDVSKLAKQLGGGGHKKAAGFMVRGRLVPQGETWQIK